MTQYTESNKQYIWRLIYPLLIFLGIQFAAQFMMTYIAMSNVAPGVTDRALLQKAVDDFVYKNGMFMQIGEAALMIPIFFRMMRYDKVRDVVFGRKKTYERIRIFWYLPLPVIGVLCAFAFNNFVDLTGLIEVSDTYRQLNGIAYNGGFAAHFIASAIAAPLLEELVFRGVIYERMRKRLPAVPCILTVAFVFGAVHGNLVQFVYAFFMGLVFTYVYEKYKSVWASATVHIGANAISIIVNEFFLSEMHVTIGTFVLITAIELAVSVLMLLFIEKKLKVKEIKDEAEGFST